MKPVKERGMGELRAFASRVRRVRALDRIGEADAQYILTRVSEIEARVVAMTETDESGEEVG
jgi:hypothetical protein